MKGGRLEFSELIEFLGVRPSLSGRQTITSLYVHAYVCVMHTCAFVHVCVCVCACLPQDHLDPDAGNRTEDRDVSLAAVDRAGSE